MLILISDLVSLQVMLLTSVAVLGNESLLLTPCVSHLQLDSVGKPAISKESVDPRSYTSVIIIILVEANVDPVEAQPWVGR